MIGILKRLKFLSTDFLRQFYHSADTAADAEAAAQE